MYTGWSWVASHCVEAATCFTCDVVKSVMRYCCIAEVPPELLQYWWSPFRIIAVLINPRIIAVLMKSQNYFSIDEVLSELLLYCWSPFWIITPLLMSFPILLYWWSPCRIIAVLLKFLPNYCRVAEIPRELLLCC